MASVTFESITKRFKTKSGQVCAVDTLSLAVADREFVVLVGPSGCGKTTTLRLLAGLEEADQGTIRIGERIVNNVAPKDRDIAMVFQDYALYPHMTVFQNLGFGLKMRRVPKSEIRRRVGEVATMLGIDDLLDRKPAALSGGERQRVAVGRAIVRKPRVFLFDEPLSNLDATLRVHMRTEIKNLHQQLETTILYVTHDQEEAMTLGDRLVILKKGVVQQCGTPLDIYNRPANRFVAGFIGSPSMNFLKGRLEQNASQMSFVGNWGRLDLSSSAPPTPDAGQTACLGIRPEHLRLGTNRGSFGDSDESTQPTTNCPSFQACVTVVEPLGDRINVHLVTGGGDNLVARVAPTMSVAPGQDVRVSVDMSRVHLFSDDDRGKRLD